MTTEDPSPNTTLVILLGASAWPNHPVLTASKAFANAANDLKTYFLDPQGFHLPQENLLDLFDVDQYAEEMDEKITQFLCEHIRKKKAESGDVARDVLVYFIGHGGTEVDSDFYLPIHHTREENPKGSSIVVGNLARTLKEQARFQRRIVILDCCFAARAVEYFQGSGLMDVLTANFIEALKEPGKGVGTPSKGTALLCSSSPKSASYFLPDETSTCFTQAFLQTLRAGNPYQTENLSLYLVNQLMRKYLQEKPESKAPMPEVHSPAQAEGDVAFVAFFPNRAKEVAAAQWVEQARKEYRKLVEEVWTDKKLDYEKLSKLIGYCYWDWNSLTLKFLELIKRSWTDKKLELIKEFWTDEKLDGEKLFKLIGYRYWDWNSFKPKVLSQNDAKSIEREVMGDFKEAIYFKQIQQKMSRASLAASQQLDDLTDGLQALVMATEGAAATEQAQYQSEAAASSAAANSVAQAAQHILQKNSEIFKGFDQIITG
jgi:Caspase domain